MLKHNKTIAIVLAFVFCMSFLAPAFIAPAVAQAAPTFSGSIKYVTSDPNPVQNLGSMKVKIAADDWNRVDAYPAELVCSLPTIFARNADIVLDTNITIDGPANVQLVSPKPFGTTAVNGSFVIQVNDISGLDPAEDLVFYVNFYNINVSNFAGPVKVTFAGSTGFLEVTPGSSHQLAVVNATGKTVTSAKSIKKITSTGDYLDTIVSLDLVDGSIKENGTITLEMVTKGFEFVNNTIAPADMATTTTPFASILGSLRFQNYIWPATSISNEKVTFITKTALGSGDKGQVSFGGIKIAVDEKVARVGQDIEVKISGAGITEQTIVVGQYVDYIVNITLDKATELIAGRDSQTLGTFFLEEVAPNTLVQSRSILLELPAGLAWDQGFEFGPSNYEVVNNSSIVLTHARMIDNRTLKLEVTTPSAKAAEEGAKILFKKLKVDVSPAYSAESVDLKISGKAGVEGVVTGVSTVVPMIKLEATTPDVMLGVKEQKVSDVVITEVKADALVDRDSWVNAMAAWSALALTSSSPIDVEDFDWDSVRNSDTALKFYLDDGFRFAKVPKVEVLEGDIVLELDDVKITTPRSGQNLLIIPIRAGSYKTPAKIKISDIYLTADRNAPTGKVALYAAETNADYANGIFASDYANAFNDTGRFALDRAAEVYLANNATEPPVENVPAGTATFVVDSNIYTVNGVTRVMEAAPYIKNGRTYVPYRYLAYALGVAEADVVWDAAAKTVTVTKGDNVVVATIGSTTLTVNGAAKTMDVAPEIVNDRTMLPARHLAEALGANVGWDPATRTVVIEN